MTILDPSMSLERIRNILVVLGVVDICQLLLIILLKNLVSNLKCKSRTDFNLDPRYQ